MWPYTQDEFNWLCPAQRPAPPTKAAIIAAAFRRAAERRVANDDGPYDPQLIVCK